MTVHTVTPNAARDDRFVQHTVDMGASIEDIVTDATGRRLVRRGSWPGGKGIICARVLDIHGQPDVRGYTLLGGETGEWIRANLNGRVRWQFLPIAAENRCTRILERDGAVPEAIHVDSNDRDVKTSTIYPTVSAEEIAALDAVLERSLRPDDYCAWGGSLPTGMPPDYYAQRVRRYPDVRHVVDTSHPLALREAANAGAYGLKPNRTELREAFGYGPEEIARLFEDYGQLQFVLLTLGREGAIFARRGGRPIKAIPPAVAEDCSLGAGDMGLGTCLNAYIRNLSDAEIVRRSVAFASHAVTLPGSSCGTPADMQAMMKYVTYETLRPA